MKKIKWHLSILFLIVTMMVVGCSSTETKEPPSNEQTESGATQNNDVSNLNWRVPEFEAIDHTGKPFTSQQVQGKIWLTDVIFTRCNNVCPPMTANMAKIQQELKKQGVDVKIVSFSVDPDHDQPKVLEEFGNKYHADLSSNWHFLTGYTFEEIQELTQTAFKGTLSKTEGPTPEVPIMINHPSRFFLIDTERKVRKFYDGLQVDPQQVVKDIRELQAN